jgi:hypothetical protein
MENPRSRFDPTDNTLIEDGADGSTTFHFDVEPEPEPDEPDESDHLDNLAEELDEAVLSTLAAELMRGIEDDDRSRAKWLAQRARGVEILGLEIEPPRVDLGSSAAPMEGMSNVRHPLLLDACLRSWATMCGELLPSQGPLKIDNEGAETEGTDQQAERLEKDLNVFLTSTSTEYIPDHKRMIWGVVWSGAGFTKGYHCPIRRRPTIESIDAAKLIVSNNATDLQNANRVTHEIDMNKSTFIRMKIAGAYRDCELSAPEAETNTLKQKIAKQQGIQITGTDPEDLDRVIWECYADIEVPGYEHKDSKGKPTGLPLPFKISIDKASRKILEIRRNWREGDEDCLKRKTFTMYGFVPMFGFYPSGLLHILGNTSNALTAAWRISLDNGMFGNFPGFLTAENGNEQDNNSLRVAPGSGVSVNVPAGSKLQDSFLPLPYKSLDPAFVQFVDNVGQAGQRLGGTAETPVGEGKQDAPVGTTLALIEQAAKTMSEVHKGACQSQMEEFSILRELLEEDPEALWRHIKRKKKNYQPWDEQTLLEALENYDLIPRADPNTPSHMHRMARAEAFAQKVKDDPQSFDIRKCYVYYFHAIGMSDVESFFAPPRMPAPPAPDPKAEAAIQTASLRKQQADEANQIKLQEMAMKEREGAANRQNKIDIENTRVAKELAIHPMSQEIIAPEPTKT